MRDSPSPRRPAQERSAQRVDAALAVAESLLVSLGPAAFSIPEVARLAGVPRAALYRFFPDKYALMGALAQRHLQAITEGLRGLIAQQHLADLQGLAETLVAAAADYYDAHPAATLLVLGGPWTQLAQQAQQQSLSDLGDVVRDWLAMRLPGVPLPRQPDLPTLAVEIAFACLKHGFQKEGRLSLQIRHEAVRAAVAYCEACWPGLGQLLAR